MNTEKPTADNSAIVIDKNPYIPNFEKKIDKMQILQKSLQDLSGLSIEQIKYRLRMIRQPVTLFGESDKERLLRLSKLQVDEQQEDDFRLASSHNAPNVFLNSRAVPQEPDDDDDDEDPEINNINSENVNERIKSKPVFNGILYSQIDGLAPEKVIYKHFKSLIK